MVEDHLAMASLTAAKQQLRSAMKQKLGAISQESAISQSMRWITTAFPREDLLAPISPSRHHQANSELP